MPVRIVVVVDPRRPLADEELAVVVTVMPLEGAVFVSVKDQDKQAMVKPVKRLVELGFKVVATGGTADFLRRHGIEAQRVNKVLEGRPHIVDLMKDGKVQLVFNTVQEAVDKTGADTTMIFVPPPFAADAIMEAADAELELIVCITEGVPTLDMVKAWECLQNRRARLIGLGLLSAPRDALGSLDRVDFVVKLLGMVNALPNFNDSPKVINGCSDLFVEVFGEAGRHARSAVGNVMLPNQISVEIEAIVAVKP